MSMQMTPASELKPLQVRLPGPVLEEFKTYAQEQGQSMASLMLGWIEAALAGSPPAPVSPTGAPATEVPSSGDVLAELKTQTALLQALVSQAAATSHGGTEPRRVVITEPEVIPSGLMSAADFMSPPAPSVPDGYRAVEEAEVVKGLEVWMKNRGIFGVVLEPPTMGVTRVQSADRGLAAVDIHFSELMVTADA